jgi:hypothetical protein
VFSPGRWTHEGIVALSASTSTAPAWHPDPSGRYSLRYWDGAVWTPSVSTDGVVTTDALP